KTFHIDAGSFHIADDSGMSDDYKINNDYFYGLNFIDYYDVEELTLVASHRFKSKENEFVDYQQEFTVLKENDFKISIELPIDEQMNEDFILPRERNAHPESSGEKVIYYSIKIKEINGIEIDENEIEKKHDTLNATSQ